MFPTRRKVAVIGWDGATLDLAKPWIAEGRLPTLAKLTAHGSSGELLSTIPAVSAVAWTTFATGKNPGKHGIFNFRKSRQNGYGLEFSCGADRRARALWQILSECGKHVIVVNIPMTYPPEPVNGILISGMDAPGTEGDFTYPKELKRELLKAVPSYTISLHLMGHLDSEEKREKAVHDILRTERDRAEALVYLLSRYPWDLMVIRFNTPDTMQHFFWKEMEEARQGKGEGQKFTDAILQAYEGLDTLTARILEQLDEQTIRIVMSDHGAGPREPRAFYLAEWLRRQGFLATKGAGNSSSATQWVARVARFVTEQVFLAGVRKLSYKSKDRLRKRMPKALSKALSIMRFAEIDWRKTRAYTAGGGSVLVNLRGRQPQGIVAPGKEYEELVELLVQQLSALTDPETQEPVFEGVYARDQVYHGPFTAEAADIVLIPRNYRYAVSTKFLRRANASVIVPEKHWRRTTGRHRRNGMLVVSGPGIRRGVEITGAEIADTAPTILHLMGLPVPKDMDGKVLTEIFEEEMLLQQPVTYEEVPEGDEMTAAPSYGVYSAEEEKVIQERLRGLGYLDD